VHHAQRRRPKAREAAAPDLCAGNATLLLLKVRLSELDASALPKAFALEPKEP
jgi:hypothetical protein